MENKKNNSEKTLTSTLTNEQVFKKFLANFLKYTQDINGIETALQSHIPLTSSSSESAVPNNLQKLSEITLLSQKNNPSLKSRTIQEELSALGFFLNPRVTSRWQGKDWTIAQSIIFDTVFFKAMDETKEAIKVEDTTGEHTRFLIDNAQKKILNDGSPFADETLTFSTHFIGNWKQKQTEESNHQPITQSSNKPHKAVPKPNQTEIKKICINALLIHLANPENIDQMVLATEQLKKRDSDKEEFRPTTIRAAGPNLEVLSSLEKASLLDASFTTSHIPPNQDNNHSQLHLRYNRIHKNANDIGCESLDLKQQIILDALLSSARLSMLKSPIIRTYMESPAIKDGNNEEGKPLAPIFSQEILTIRDTILKPILTKTIEENSPLFVVRKDGTATASEALYKKLLQLKDQIQKEETAKNFKKSRLAILTTTLLTATITTFTLNSTNVLSTLSAKGLLLLGLQIGIPIMVGVMVALALVSTLFLISKPSSQKPLLLLGTLFLGLATIGAAVASQFFSLSSIIATEVAISLAVGAIIAVLAYIAYKIALTDSPRWLKGVGVGTMLVLALTTAAVVPLLTFGVIKVAGHVVLTALIAKIVIPVAIITVMCALLHQAYRGYKVLNGRFEFEQRPVDLAKVGPPQALSADPLQQSNSTYNQFPSNKARKVQKNEESDPALSTGQQLSRTDTSLSDTDSESRGNNVVVEQMPESWTDYDSDENSRMDAPMTSNSRENSTVVQRTAGTHNQTNTTNPAWISQQRSQEPAAGAAYVSLPH